MQLQNSHSQSIRYGGFNFNQHHDLPIYQAEVITGHRRQSISNNDVVFATSYSYNNDDRSGSSISSTESGYLSGGRSDNGNERRSNSLRLIRVMISFTLLFTIIIRYVEGGGTSSSPLELLTKMILMPQRLSSIIGSSSSRSNQEKDASEDEAEEEEVARPSFVFEHPYVTSSYYTSTKSIQTLLATQNQQVIRNLRREAEQAAGIEDTTPEIRTRLAIVRPFCEFDAEALPTTFTCWNALTPCKAAADDIGDDMDEEDLYEGDTVGYRRYLNEQNSDRHGFDFVGSDAMKSANADVFLFYSQTFSENDVAIKAVDAIIDQFFEPGGWSQCFGNIYAIEANIPQELDLYIPSAQEELYSWVNGPNRQFEAAVRIIQSGEWGEYDGFYLMEGDSVPVKAHWLDVVLSEIEVNRPFAILGA